MTWGARKNLSRSLHNLSHYNPHFSHRFAASKYLDSDPPSPSIVPQILLVRSIYPLCKGIIKRFLALSSEELDYNILYYNIESPLSR